ncbi:hypothetical protein D8T32_08830 [Vibrio vulnificus]|uniref:hypothetical protein n=1 Tax=Vibrio vulnificus TaxID=672 RepID=UPI00102A845D|nr:hypothetical protein [Vibrio vulnificus]EGR0751049.1 hypothetical protein [Vibrio vulnificus]RZP96203.1 hypothetical protein D8T54_11730 [Vibrio vulnificus]
MRKNQADSENRQIEAKSRRLSDSEIQALRRDMFESSAWAKAELKRRRAAKNKKNSAHGIDDGIDNDHSSN